MATRTRKKAVKSTLPTLGQIEKQVGKLRKDIERTATRVSREAVSYIPKSSRRQFNEIVDQVGTVNKRVTKAVKTARADVEDTVQDLRGTVDKRVKALRKDVTETSQKALDTVEKELRKQVEGFLKTIGVPVRSDLDGIKRRVGSLERKVEALVEGQMRKHHKASESEAA